VTVSPFTGKPPLVDSVAAAAQLGIRPVTIRSWATRGKVQRYGKDRKGRTLYNLVELTLALRAAA
jgi:DNA-binding transcriptional MerR regulator